MQDNIKDLYNSLTEDGYDFGSEEKFRRNIGNVETAKQLYASLTEDGYDFGSEEKFLRNVMPQTPEPEPSKGMIASATQKPEPPASIARPTTNIPTQKFTVKEQNEENAAKFRVQQENTPFMQRQRAARQQAEAMNKPAFPDIEVPQYSRSVADDREKYKGMVTQAIGRAVKAKSETALGDAMKSTAEELARQGYDLEAVQQSGLLNEGIENVLAPSAEAAVTKGNRIIDKVFDDAQKKALNARAEATRYSGMGGTGMMGAGLVMGEKAYNKEIDPEKLQAQLIESIDKDALRETFNEVYRQAVRYGIDPKDYFNSYVAPHLKQNAARALDKFMTDQYMPKNDAEYVLSGFSDSITGMLSDWLTKSASQNAYKQMALSKYDASDGMKIARQAVGLIASAPEFAVSGGVSSAVVKKLCGSALTNIMARGYTQAQAQRILASELARRFGTRVGTRIMQSSLSGSVNFAALEGMSEGARQLRDDDFSVGNIVRKTAEGGFKGAIFGAVGGSYAGATEELHGATKVVSNLLGVPVNGAALTISSNAVNELNMMMGEPDELATEMDSDGNMHRKSLLHQWADNTMLDLMMRGTSHHNLNVITKQGRTDIGNRLRSFFSPLSESQKILGANWQSKGISDEGRARLQEITGADNMLDALSYGAPKAVDMEKIVTPYQAGGVKPRSRSVDDLMREEQRQVRQQNWDRIMNDRELSAVDKQKLCQIMGAKYHANPTVSAELVNGVYELRDAKGLLNEKREDLTQEERNSIRSQRIVSKAMALDSAGKQSVVATAYRYAERPDAEGKVPTDEQKEERVKDFLQRFTKGELTAEEIASVEQDLDNTTLMYQGADKIKVTSHRDGTASVEYTKNGVPVRTDHYDTQQEANNAAARDRYQQQLNSIGDWENDVEITLADGQKATLQEVYEIGNNLPEGTLRQAVEGYQGKSMGEVRDELMAEGAESVSLTVSPDGVVRTTEQDRLVNDYYDWAKKQVDGIGAETEAKTEPEAQPQTEGLYQMGEGGAPDSTTPVYKTPEMPRGGNGLTTDSQRNENGITTGQTAPRSKSYETGMQAAETDDLSALTRVHDQYEIAVKRVEEVVPADNPARNAVDALLNEGRHDEAHALVDNTEMPKQQADALHLLIDADDTIDGVNDAIQAKTDAAMQQIEDGVKAISDEQGNVTFLTLRSGKMVHVVKGDINSPEGTIMVREIDPKTNTPIGDYEQITIYDIKSVGNTWKASDMIAADRERVQGELDAHYRRAMTQEIVEGNRILIKNGRSMEEVTVLSENADGSVTLQDADGDTDTFSREQVEQMAADAKQASYAAWVEAEKQAMQEAEQPQAETQQAQEPVATAQKPQERIVVDNKGNVDTVASSPDDVAEAIANSGENGKKAVAKELANARDAIRKIEEKMKKETAIDGFASLMKANENAGKYQAELDALRQREAFWKDQQQRIRDREDAERKAAEQARIELENKMKAQAQAMGTDEPVAHNQRAVTKGGLVIDGQSVGIDSGTATTLDAIGKALGVEIRIDNSLTTGNGMWSPGRGKNGLNLISIKSDTNTALSFLYGHEITHEIKNATQGNDKLWQGFVQAVRKAVGEAEFDARVKEAQERWNEEIKIHNEKLKAKGRTDFVSLLDEAGATEEVCCDFVGERIISDKDFANRLLEEVEKSGESSASIAQRIRDFIDKILKAMREIVNPTDEQRRQIEGLEQAKKIWGDLYEFAAAKEREKREAMAEAERQRKEEELRRKQEARKRATEKYDKPINDARKRMGDDPDALAVMEDGNREPKTLKEAVAQMIPAHSLVLKNWTDANGRQHLGLEGETGLKHADLNRLSTFIGKRENGAVDITTLAERIYENLPEDMRQQAPDADRDIRNVIIELFSEAEKADDILHYVDNARIREAEAVYQRNKDREAYEAEREAYGQKTEATDAAPEYDASQDPFAGLDTEDKFSIRTKPEPEKKGIGYKVFYRGKDGKLYPPMVANPNGADTPIGVWLDADAAPIVNKTKTGRDQVKLGGKGTQGGSGYLSYRPGWHLGEIPYALQFNRYDANGERTLFPKDFVWAEVEYAADKDYQEEATKAGMSKNGKYRHSYAGLPYLPEDGYYKYRTNPDPNTDPWIITGAMKVNRVLSREEVDDLVRKAGREPQKVEGDENTKLDDKFSIAQRDKEYADAVAAGDKEKVDAMLREEAARKGYSDNVDYQGSLAFNGAAPSKNGYFETRQERIEAFDNGDFEDTYSLGDFVETGLDNHDLEWQLANPIPASGRDKATLESIRNLNNAVKSKSGKIKMYRAVDADIKENSFRNGDWITPSREYAQKHIGLQDWKKGRVIEQEVSIDDVWWDGNDINEWGYDDGKGYVYKNTENNRKLLEATYDDKGNLIPLSKRFDEKKSDVKFSIPPKKNADGDTEFSYEGDPKFSIRVFHGSGADFEKFDHKFMGTGEGNQSFGWGTYVTEVEGVGRQYAEAMGNSQTYKGKTLESNPYSDIPADRALFYIEQEGGTDKAIKFLKELIREEDDADTKREYQECIDVLRDKKSWGKSERHIYQVDIPDDNGRNYIDWKAPLTEENKEDIRAGLIKDNFFRGQEQMTYDDLKSRGLDVPGFEEWLGLRADVLTTSYNGEDFYKGLSQALGGDQIASEFLRDCGFTGIKYPVNAMSGGNSEGTHNYVIFDENDAQIVNNTKFSFPKKKEDKTLMGVHNISEDKLKKALKLGGLANPSLAVIDTEKQSHTGFGDISLIPKSSLIDAKTGRNAGTYLGDAWTPTYPNVTKSVSKQGEAHIKAIAQEAAGDDKVLADRFERAIHDYVNGNSGNLAFLFLKQKGLNPEVKYPRISHSHEEYEQIEKIFGKGTAQMPSSPTDEQNKALFDMMVAQRKAELEKRAEKISDEAKRKTAVNALLDDYKKDIADENGKVYFARGDSFVNSIFRDEQRRNRGEIDWYGTDLDANNRVAKEGLSEEYNKWKENLLGDEDINEELFAGWTKDGYRRYVPNTVENASRLMNKETQTNSNNEGGIGATKSALLKKVSTLAAIRKNKGKLQDAETVSAKMQEASDELLDMIHYLADKQKVDDNRFINLDIAEHRLQEALAERNPVKYLNKEYRYNIDENGEYAQQIKDFIKMVGELPAKYFETKFRRPVGLDEFAVAVVPEGTSEEVIKGLKDAGLDVRTYDGTEENRKAVTMNAVNGREDIKFSIAIERSDPFYSNAAKATEDIRQEKATGDQWLAMIKKNGGLKAEEDKWMGLSDWLRGKKSVTKAELQKFIADNAVEIEDVEYAETNENALEKSDIFKEWQELGGDEDAYNEMIERYGDDFSMAFEYDGETLMINDEGAAQYFIGDADYPINSTRLDYTTEGLENKREIALTVPTIEPYNEHDEIHFGDAGGGRAVAWIRFGDATGYNHIERISQEIEAAKEEVRKRIPDAQDWSKWGKENGYRDILYSPNEGKPDRTYIVDKSEKAKQRGLENSFGLFVNETFAGAYKTLEDAVEAYKNYVADKEVKDVEDVPQKVLVIDEIQSKRHQDGREKGYKKEIPSDAPELIAYENAQKETEQYLSMLREKYGRDDVSYGLTEGERQKLDELHDKEFKAKIDYGKFLQGNKLGAFDESSVPDAPFQKTWHELALKRMLRYAAENGYDKIAWTTGEQQADRYNMSELVDEINTTRLLDGRYEVEGVKNGERVFGEYYTEDKLPEIVGKELANKIVSGEDNQSFKGDDLRIGGHGMEGFYDRMLPQFMDKYGKKWGVKTGEVELDLPNEADRVMHSVDVTPEMKESVMKGQPKFSVSKREAALRDALIGKIREAGIDVVTDEKEGQRVLDMLNNGSATLNKAQKRALETASLIQTEGSPADISSADVAKVQNNLETLAKKYDNLTKNSRKNFLEEVATELGATEHGSKSKYVTIEAKNGNIVTIRLANHNAKVSTFDKNDEDNGISIVVSKRANEGITNDGNAHVVEYYYPETGLRRAEGKPLADIVRAIQQSLYSGEFNDPTGLAERQEVNNEQIRQHKAFHGSGADFDAFDHSHMGEGEGAQAYGWGTYLTEVEGIGKTYARSMARKPIGARPVLYKGEPYEKASQDGWSDAKKEVFDELAQRQKSMGKSASVAKWDLLKELDHIIKQSEHGVERSKNSEEKWQKAIEYLEGMTDEQFEELVSSERWKDFDGDLRFLKIAINDNLDLGRGGVMLECEELLDISKQNQRMYANRQNLAEAKMDALKEFDDSDFSRMNYEATLYTVDIPDDNGTNYLVYDAKMEQQPEQLEAISRGLEKLGWKQNGMTWSNATHKVGFELAPYKKGSAIYEALSGMLGSKKAASEFLHSVGVTGIKFPAEFRSGGREDDAMNYVIFNENDAKISNKVKFFRTAEGTAYGFVKDGKIYIDPRIATSETPVHEYSHLWTEALRKKAPEKWEKIKRTLLSDESVKPFIDKVRSEYSKLTDENDLLDEVLAQYSGKRGAERLREIADEIASEDSSQNAKAIAVSALAKVRNTLNEFWRSVADMFGWKQAKASDIADKMLSDLLNAQDFRNSDNLQSGDSKSATENNGNFDATNPDIRFSIPTIQKGDTFEDVVRKGQEIKKFAILKRMRQRKGESAEDFIQRQQDYLNLAVKSPQEARNRVVDEIKERLDSKSVDEMGKKALNQLLQAVRDAKEENLPNLIKRVNRTINELQDKALTRQMKKLLDTKTVKRNQRNMSVAGRTDDAVAQAFDFMKGKLVDVDITEHDSEKKRINASIAECNARIRDLERQLSEATDPAEHDRIAAEIADQKDLKDELREELDGVQKEIDKARSENVTVTTQSVNDMIADLDEKFAKSTIGEGEWTSYDAARLTACHILNKRLKLNDLMAESKNLQTEIAQLEAMRTEANKAHNKQQAKMIDRDIVAHTDMMDDILQQIVATKQEINNDLSGMVEGGKTSLMAKKEQEQVRKRSLILGFYNDIASGKFEQPSQEKAKKDAAFEGGVISNIREGLRNTVGSFEYLMQHMPKNTLGQDSWMYRYFMLSKDGVMAAQENYMKGIFETQRTMNDKMKELWGEKNYEDAIKQNEKHEQNHGVTILVDSDGMEVRMNAGEVVNTDGGLSKAQATYLYMVWKMPDGRAKLEKMGFDEQSIAEAVEFIGEKNKAWADWVQEEFLPTLREKYNERYVEMYYTSLGKVANYVPLKINQEARHQDVDVDEMMGRQTLNQKTGSLINRTHNLIPVDLTRGAYEIISEHVQNMEEWYHMARVRQDLNYILSSTAIRGAMNANERASHSRLVKAAQIATGCYKTDQGSGSKIVSGLTSGLAAANIALRNTTALKQTLSLPAFLGYSQDPRYIVQLLKNSGIEYAHMLPTFAVTAATMGYAGRRAMMNAAGSEKNELSTRLALSNTMRWCIENMPSFRQRVAKGSVGNVLIDEFLSGDKNAWERFKAKLGEYGMAANGLVDATTCAIGIKSIYDYKYGQLKKQADKDLKDGLITQEEYETRLAEADRLARCEADIYYNGTQQSTHPAFLAPIQMDRDLASKMFTLYKNSPLSYARKALLNAQTLSKLRNWKTLQEEYARQYMEADNELSLEKAMSMANNKLTKELGAAAFNTVLYGYFINWLWNWGGKGLLGWLQGEEDEEEEANKTVPMKIAEYTCPVLNGVPMVDFVVNTMAGQDVEPLLLYDVQQRLAKAMKGKEGEVSEGLLFDVVNNIAFRSGLGIDLNTVGNVYLGAEHLVKNGLGEDNRTKMIALMYLLNTPNSNRKQVARTIYSEFDDPDEFVEAVMLADKAVREGTESYKRFMPGFKEYDQKKVDEIIKEWLKLRATPEQKEAMKQKKANTLRELEKTYTDRETLQRDYDNETDPTIKKRMGDLLKKMQKGGSGQGIPVGDRANQLYDQLFVEKPVKDSEYLRLSTSEDVKADYNLSKQIKHYKAFWDELKKITDEDEAMEYEQQHEKEIERYATLSKIQGRINSLKGKLKKVTDAKEQQEIMQAIRDLRSGKDTDTETEEEIVTE